MILFNPDEEIDIIKKLIIFFIVGCIVHILLEYFNFNNLCYDKVCFGKQCRTNNLTQ